MKASPVTQSMEEVALQERALHHRDPLTRLPNRVFFEDRVSLAISLFRRREQPFAVVSLQLDGFAEIRERSGGRVADQVLKVLAVSMKPALRRGDLLARLCGEHFAAVILDTSSPKEVLPVVRRLMRAVTEPVQVGDQTMQISASIGVAFYPQEQEVDVKEILAQAEHAMLQAQGSGRNLYHFCEAARVDSAEERERKIDRIRKALEKKEFHLLYQPLVHLGRGEVIGVEGLIRWSHPERGLLAPSEFLPLIEEHHLAIEIGEWVIDEALRQIEAWRQAGLELLVGVNISSSHFCQVDFAKRLAEMLSHYPAGIGQKLWLEIHGAGQGKTAPLVSTVKACQEQGVSAALDDFGSSRSSLADLKEISVQALKIDSLFVRDLQSSLEDVAIFEAIVGMAEVLGRKCVAVGVENPELGLQLLRLGCEIAQGYGIAMPMAAAAVPEWVAGWAPDPSWLDVDTVGVEERLMVYTSVEHKAWIDGLEVFLKGEEEDEPRLNRHQCQLGHFIDGEEQAGRNSHPSFQALAALHWRIHAMVPGIVKLHEQGRIEESLARLGDMREFFEKLMESLRNFRMKA
jgi:diguanylate cyclase (GGDEF)-like protein